MLFYFTQPFYQSSEKVCVIKYWFLKSNYTFDDFLAFLWRICVKNEFTGYTEISLVDISKIPWNNKPLLCFVIDDIYILNIKHFLVWGGKCLILKCIGKNYKANKI